MSTTRGRPKARSALQAADLSTSGGGTKRQGVDH